MDKFGRSEINPIKDAINRIINILISPSFTMERESKDLDIFTGGNNISNIAYLWTPYIRPEDEMATTDRLGGNYSLIDKTKTGVLINYDLIPDIYFTEIEIVPRDRYVYKTKYLYIILERDGKEILRSVPGRLIMKFERVLADKFKLCFDEEIGNNVDTSFTYIKFSYVTLEELGEDQRYLINLKNFL